MEEWLYAPVYGISKIAYMLMAEVQVAKTKSERTDELERKEFEGLCFHWGLGGCACFTRVLRTTHTPVILPHCARLVP